MIPTSPVMAQRIASRSRDAYRRISEKPTTVSFQDAYANIQATTTIRIEFDNNESQAQGVAGAASRRKCILFGVRGHATQPDTQIVKGWRFGHEGRTYEVQSVILTLGEIQAVAEVVN